MRRLYESVCPLDDATMEALSERLEPFWITEPGDLEFSQSDHTAGCWHSYFIGIVGCLASEEADVLWPNQVHT